MAQLPDNIAAILGVDFSGNVVNIDTSILVASQTSQPVSISEQFRVPKAQEEEPQTDKKPNVVNNYIQQEAEPFLILADSFYIPLVNTEKTNFTNSAMYQIGGKIGVNNISPAFLFDVRGGSINVANTAAITTYGYKIDGKNVAYSQSLYNTIVMGNTTTHSIVRMNSLAIGNMEVTPPTGEGVMSWNDGEGTVDLVLKGGHTTLQLGQELVARCYNAESTALLDGEIVYIYGSQGNRVSVKRASNSSESASSVTFGMVTEPIAAGAEGFVTIAGKVNKLNTSALTAGTALWLGSVAGTYTSVKPIAPNHAVLIGYVERSHATVGSIYVKIQNGYEIEELHNVLIGTKVNKDFLYYDGGTSLWKNAQFDSIMTIGGQVSGTYGNMVLVNDAVISKTLNGSYTTVSGIVQTGDSIQIAFGKLQNQINGLSGSLVYKGTWNASTNTPTITSGTGTNGNFYIVSVAGSTTIDGTSTWAVGDWIIFNGTTWQRIVNSAVTSVNGKTGIVTLTTDDITEGSTNKYFTNTLAVAAMTGAISTVTTSNLDVDRALISNGSGKIAASTITSTQLSYLSGATSNIQAQINTKEPSIVAGTTAQYWRGDKSWATLNTDAVPESSTPTNKYYTDARVAAYLTGAISGILTTNLTGDRVLISSASGKIAASTITTTQLGYLSTISSNVQNQIDGKEPSIAAGTTAQYWRGDKTWQTLSTAVLAILNGPISTMTTGSTTADRAVITDSSGKLAVSSVTSTQLSYLLDLTGNIQTQLNSKQTALTNPITGTGVANQVAYFNGTGSITGSSSFAVDIASASLRFNGSMTLKGTDVGFTFLDNADVIRGRFIATGTNMIFRGPILKFQIGDTDRILVNASGNVSLSSIDDLYRLDVGGDINTSTLYRIAGVPYSVASSSTSGFLTFAHWNLFNSKEPAITAGTTSQYWRGDKTWQTLPVYTLAGLGGEPAITAGTAAQYWRGDKTWATLPVYTLAGLGGVPTTRTITINGVAYDLSADRSWTISTGGVTGTGTQNYIAKWGAGGTSLTNGSIIDTGSSLSFFSAPPQPYFFNIKNNVSTGKFLSIWAPTDSNGAFQTGFLSHNGNGLFDQAPLFFNALNFEFGVGIQPALSIDSSRNVKIKGANVFGGGTLQVAGDVNITGQFLVNGSPITSGGGSGAVSSVFGRTGAITSQFGDYNISQIGGISISGPTAGQVLTYNGSSWINAAPTGGGGGGGATYLYQLLDTNISGQTVGQALVWNGSKWTNQTISGGGGGGNYISGTGSSGYVPKFSDSSTITNSPMYFIGNDLYNDFGFIRASSFYESSDLRLKNIISRDSDVVKFTWSDKRDDLIHIGYIAQEVKERYPSQVVADKNGYLSVNYTEILVDKTRQLEKKIEALENEVFYLKSLKNG